MTPTVVLLGNLLVDDLVFADSRTRMSQAGGAILYAAVSARLWDAAAGCVSVAGSDYLDNYRRFAPAYGHDATVVHLSLHFVVLSDQKPFQWQIEVGFLHVHSVGRS